MTFRLKPTANYTWNKDAELNMIWKVCRDGSGQVVGTLMHMVWCGVVYGYGDVAVGTVG